MLTIKSGFILTFINDIDTKLFLFLNGIHSPVWDEIFSWVTGRGIWVPVFIAILILAILKFKWRFVYVGLLLGVVILLADQTSVVLFKNVFERLRPCHNPAIADIVHTIDDHCGGSYGFVSSHAANSFGVAIYAGLLLKKQVKWMLPIIMFWAVLVSYSRVYVGVHYPGDVLGGAILGTIIGILVLWLTRIINRQFNLKIENI